MAENCVFCRHEVSLDLSAGERKNCPLCGVMVLASPGLPEANRFLQELHMERLETWETLITIKDGLYYIFLWDPNELLSTIQVADILDVTSTRTVARMVRNGFLPNAVRKARGTKGFRYLIPRKDVANYLSYKSRGVAA
ncbi:MAG: helix-turn-helix domain-containing protein [Anaerolineales bacterium]|nr:helix-turn-helix domain-containing protein [Anaerolineales bacterium]